MEKSKDVCYTDYRGFSGTVEYDEKTRVYRGTISDLSEEDYSPVECVTMEEADEKICGAIDDYIDSLVSLEYRGIEGLIEYDDNERVFRIDIEGIEGGGTIEGQNMDDATDAFIEAVDDYLDRMPQD